MKSILLFEQIPGINLNNMHMKVLSALKSLFSRSSAAGAPSPRASGPAYVQTAVPATLPDEPAFYISRSAHHLFAFRPSAAILSDSRELIHKIKFASGLEEQVFDLCVMPLIRNLSRLTSVLPASEAAHDHSSCGLFRHSLKVALIALELLPELYPQAAKPERRAYALGVIYIALCHDLGKLWNDMEVFDDRGCRWSPFCSEVEFFLLHSSSRFAHVNFKRGRRQKHDSCPPLQLMYLGRELRILSLMEPVMSIEELIRGEHFLWNVVTKADTQAAAAEADPQSPSVSVPSFVKAKLLSALSSGRFRCNTPDAQCFAVAEGILIRCGSECDHFIRDLYISLTDRENGRTALAGLATCGIYKLEGVHRVFAWHRLVLGKDLLYVRGTMVKGALPDDLSQAGWAPRGTMPYELSQLLAEFRAEFSAEPVLLYRKDGAMLSGPFRRADFDSICFEQGESLTAIPQPTPGVTTAPAATANPEASGNLQNPALQDGNSAAPALPPELPDSWQSTTTKNYAQGSSAFINYIQPLQQLLLDPKQTAAPLLKPGPAPAAPPPPVPPAAEKTQNQPAEPVPALPVPIPAAAGRTRKKSRAKT